ncbi:hypothetical protein D3C78_1893210 [compost metagenome]
MAGAGFQVLRVVFGIVVEDYSYALAGTADDSVVRRFGWAGNKYTSVYRALFRDGGRATAKSKSGNGQDWPETYTSTL